MEDAVLTKSWISDIELIGNATVILAPAGNVMIGVNRKLKSLLATRVNRARSSCTPELVRHLERSRKFSGKPDATTDSQVSVRVKIASGLAFAIAQDITGASETVGQKVPIEKWKAHSDSRMSEAPFVPT